MATVEEKLKCLNHFISIQNEEYTKKCKQFAPDLIYYFLYELITLLNLRGKDIDMSDLNITKNIRGIDCVIKSISILQNTYGYHNIDVYSVASNGDNFATYDSIVDFGEDIALQMFYNIMNKYRY